MNTAPIPSTAIYRLRFTLEDKEHTVDLKIGQFRIGSSRSADIYLPVAGVSRQHALLTVTASTLVIEDLESTNGTLVNGTRVLRSSIPVGAEVRIGPVRSRVEEVAADDTELAIVLNTPSAPSRRPPTPRELEETTLVMDESPTQASSWLDWIGGFVERLATSTGNDIGPALSFLGEVSELSGCCLVQWPQSGDPVSLAAWASVFEIPSLDEVQQRALASESVDPATICGVSFLQGDPLISVGFVIRPRLEPIGLVLWGDFAGRLSSASFLRALILLIDDRLRDSGNRTPESNQHVSTAYPDLIFPASYRPGTSPPMAGLYAHMRPLLKGRLPVLINGETGVGKELVARILHQSSDRRQGPFVAVNCAAIPNDLLESEMFGIGRGVATGVEARRGKFQLAEGGTLFLDEIGEMAPALQAKLLRALQEQEIHPLGGRPQPIDVRVVSATNVDLTEHMQSGALRTDLFYRLAGFVLEVPPLRRCPEDIPGLVEHFLRIFSDGTKVQVRGITVAALRLLTSYSWPGNIRELEHEVRRLVYTSQSGEVIHSERISERLRGEKRSDLDPAERFVDELESLDLGAAVQAVERRMIRAALRQTGGVKIEACRILGLSRNGLDKKMKRLDIQVQEDPSPAEAS